MGNFTTPDDPDPAQYSPVVLAASLSARFYPYFQPLIVLTPLCMCMMLHLMHERELSRYGQLCSYSLPAPSRHDLLPSQLSGFRSLETLAFALIIIIYTGNKAYPILSLIKKGMPNSRCRTLDDGGQGSFKIKILYIRKFKKTLQSKVKKMFSLALENELKASALCYLHTRIY